MKQRSRRLRSSSAIRQLVQEHHLSSFDLWQPFFVIEGNLKEEAISSMPGISRYSVDLLLKQVEHFINQGGTGAILFGISSQKDEEGKEAYNSKGPVASAVRTIKKHFPEFCVATDVCLCAYLSHGHCGIVKDGNVQNDQTLPILTRMALCHAEAGADFVAPSDMMDGRVAHIRNHLDQNSFEHTGLLSYAVKYASAFYGPFRDAAKSKAQFGDRRTYQMNPANSREALKEARQDVGEGADMIMVKPALAYLDIIYQLRQSLDVPIAAYNVSGEYAMIKAAAKSGFIDEKECVLETLLSMKRAGADLIISYHAKDVLTWLK